MTTSPATKRPMKPERKRLKFEKTTFGAMAILPMPPDCDVILVCVDRLQHEPTTIYLSHQLYREKIRALFKKYPDAQSITIMPYRNADKIEIDRDLTVIIKEHDNG